MRKVLKALYIPAFILLINVTPVLSQVKPHKIYGELFTVVQMSRVFPDSKTFPDCIPQYHPDTIMTRYKIQKNKKNFNLKAFVLKHFSLPPGPRQSFSTDTTQNIKEHINRLWEVLKREPDEISNTSLIPLPHSYIVPGGRFREIYYWDSYFTMLGLKASGHYNLIRDMVENFAWMTDTLGFIPNGNRTYYLSRSQPPFFLMMVQLLAETEGDKVFEEFSQELYREFQYWREAGNNNVKDEFRFRYYDTEPAPRPESFYEDSVLAVSSEKASEQLYTNIRSACESGWDFSSRWLEGKSELSSIKTSSVYPVDLNALLYGYAVHFSDSLSKNTPGDLKHFIRTRLWNDSSGFFMDYDFEEKKHTGVLSLAGMYPLFMNIATKKQAARVAEKIKEDFLMEGGVVTTLTKTGEQWDYPNGWPPLQYITIIGLRNYGYSELAGEIKRRFMTTVEEVFYSTGKIMEKYNVVNPDIRAGGGEYPAQDGFGWTNGVYMHLLTEE